MKPHLVIVADQDVEIGGLDLEGDGGPGGGSARGYAQDLTQGYLLQQNKKR